MAYYGIVPPEIMSGIEDQIKSYYWELRKGGMSSEEAHVMAQRKRSELIEMANQKAQYDLQQGQKPSDSKQLMMALGMGGAGALGMGLGPELIKIGKEALGAKPALSALEQAQLDKVLMENEILSAQIPGAAETASIPEVAGAGGIMAPASPLSTKPFFNEIGGPPTASEMAGTGGPGGLETPEFIGAERVDYLPEADGMSMFEIGDPSYSGIAAGVIEGIQGLQSINAKDREAAAQHLALIAPDIYLAGLPSLAYALLGRWGPAKKVMDTVLAPIAKPLDLGMQGLGIANKSTKQYQAERWGKLMDEGSQYADLMQQSYLANHPENDTGIYQDGPFAGKRWDQVTKDELIADDPLSGNLWLGNLETFGPQWHEIPLDKRAEFIKRAQAEGLYSDDKGDVLIFSENQPRARAIMDEITSGSGPDASTPSVPGQPEDRGTGGLPLNPESPLMRSALLDLIPSWQEMLNPDWADYASPSSSSLTQALMPQSSGPARLDLSKMQFQKPVQPAGGGFYYR